MKNEEDEESIRKKKRDFYMKNYKFNFENKSYIAPKKGRELLHRIFMPFVFSYFFTISFLRKTSLAKENGKRE